MSRRTAAGAALLALALAGAAAAALGPPRLVALNAGLLLVHPAWRGAAAMAAAGAAAFGALLAPRRSWRAAGAVCAVLLLVFGAQRLRFRVLADADGLSVRGLAGTERIAWPEAGALRTGPGRMEVTARDGRVVEIATGRLRPEDRATLERSAARRIREASGRDGARGF